MIGVGRALGSREAHAHPRPVASASSVGVDASGAWAVAECRLCGAHLAVRPYRPGSMADALASLWADASRSGWRLVERGDGLAWVCPRDAALM